MIDALLQINAQKGTNINRLTAQILESGSHVNAKREAKGLSPRALRVAVIGFPNVGKSAVINRLVGRRRAKSNDLPGVTRQLVWIKVGKDAASAAKKKRPLSLKPGKGGNLPPSTGSFELLDTPASSPPTSETNTTPTS